MAQLLTYLQDPTLQYVLGGIMLAAGSAALVGTFMLLEKKELTGDAVSHALLPGLCLGFMATGTQSSPHLIAGALASGGLALYCIDAIPRYSKLKQDSATSLILALFFGVGTSLLTYLQQTENQKQAGLHEFLLGHASSLMWKDVRLFVYLAFLLVVVTTLCFKELQLLTFDRAFAQSIGWPVRWLALLLQLLTLLAIVVGIRAVGMIMMAAMLISPAAAARYWTDGLGKTLLLATCLGALAAGIGTLLSLSAPNTPTGPCIILTTTLLTLLSFFFAPRRGYLACWLAQRRYQQKRLAENVLKLLYEQGHLPSPKPTAQSVEALQAARPFTRWQLQRTLRHLVGEGLACQPTPTAWLLTPAGVERATYILRLHTLWETYLMRYLRLPPDHVHEDAEAIEHLLTPELATMLTEALESPPQADE